MVEIKWDHNRQDPRGAGESFEVPDEIKEKYGELDEELEGTTVEARLKSSPPMTEEDPAMKKRLADMKEQFQDLKDLRRLIKIFLEKQGLGQNITMKWLFLALKRLDKTTELTDFIGSLMTWENLSYDMPVPEFISHIERRMGGLKKALKSHGETDI